MEMIKVSRNENGIETVNARDLYSNLEIKTKFSDWITRRIDDYGFIYDTDYTTILKNETSPPSREYHISVDMAKHLAMLERSKKGMEIRQWFIDREKRLRSIENHIALPNFNDPAEAAEAWAKEYREKDKAQKALKEAQPKIAVHDHIEVSINSITVAQMANLLTKKGFKIGQNNLFKWFYDQKYLKDSDRPYQKYLDMGLFEIRKVTYMDNDDKERTTHKVMITGKGQAYFMKKLISKQDNEQIQIPL
jgi:anti-repressor protein